MRFDHKLRFFMMLAVWTIGRIIVLPVPSGYGQPPVAKGEVTMRANGFQFTEGPAWDGKEGLYFSDIPNKKLYRCSESNEVQRIREGEQASNGIVVGPHGDLFFCEIGGRRIVRRDAEGNEETLTDRCDGKPLGMPNDLWMAPDGGIYFTIPKHNPQRGKAIPSDAVHGTVCHLSADRKSVRNVGIGLKSPNGIVGSADGKWLYVADPGWQKCWRYRINSDGSLSDQQVAADSGSDGLALDIKGNLYVTAKEGVRVHSPDAKLLTIIPFPESPSNMKFGGKDGRTLWVTARTGLYSVELNIPGDLGKMISRPRPYRDQAQSIPGRIEAEWFDEGGEGVAYHDADELNKGSGKLNIDGNEPDVGFRRHEAVDISYTQTPSGTSQGDVTVDGKPEIPDALYVGWVQKGEWLCYTVNVAESGRYSIGGHLSAKSAGTTFRLRCGSSDKSQSVEIAIPETGSAHRWGVYSNLAEVELEKGIQTITLEMGPVPSFNIDWLAWERKP